MDRNTNPFKLFAEWMALAEKSEPNDPNAMSLSTVGVDGRPSSRIVLLKAYDDTGFTFFTNSESQKGKDLAQNPNVALLLHWKSLLRQVRIEGTAEIVSREETTRYFHSRHRNSQIASYASDQSRPLCEKSIYEDKMKELETQFSDVENIPCPDHWNGYRVIPTKMEFWIQQDFRTHDRFTFTQNEKGIWINQRLYP